MPLYDFDCRIGAFEALCQRRAQSCRRIAPACGQAMAPVRRATLRS